MHVELFFLVAGAVLVTALCRQRGWPSPLVLVATALVVSFLPGVPRFEVDSELILGFVLPPLLYSAALSTSYRDFRKSIGSIMRLGVGLVVLTAVAVAAVAWYLIPELPFTAALVLGAVVAPPDAVAAAAVSRKLGLPRRVTTLLMGESLINDATSLTLFKVALLGVATGSWSIYRGLEVFAVAVLVGVGLGVGIGYVLHRLRLHLDDPVVASAIGVLAPFAAYWGAEAIEGSGVLAVVAAGLYLAHTSPHAGYATRLYQQPLWSTLDLLLEGFTFALIGVQLKWVISDVDQSDQGLGLAVLVAVAVLATAVVVRLVYVMTTSRGRGSRTRRGRAPSRDALFKRESLVVSWAGMRGVVTLAAAAAIPSYVNGQPFPAHATLQLIAYTVAIGTLLVQGLSLPAFIRRLRVGSQDENERDAAQEAALRLATSRAAQQVIDRRTEEMSGAPGTVVVDELTRQLVRTISRRAEAAAALLDPTRMQEDDATLTPETLTREQGRRATALRREVIAAQREVLVARRDTGELDEAVMQRVLRELDIEDERLSTSWLSRI